MKKAKPKKVEKVKKKSDADFEEIELNCTICGKPTRVVIYKGFDTSDYICPRCEASEFGEEEEDSDI
jgi:5-methylcytosine-specific restriction endonuclease McrA